MVVRCPRCKSVVEWDGNPFRPFCSERCKLIDTGDWLDERHRVPCEDPKDFEEGLGETGHPDDEHLKTH